ncbi:hypothetical protein [Halorubrum sp. DTA98]|uniref:hypothetical protein n=1 Tax=Halorubrum sp. DTA98 TaxID=3402163 RepID=UPI003AAB6851
MTIHYENSERYLPIRVLIEDTEAQSQLGVKTVENTRVLETPGLGFHQSGKPMVRSNPIDKEVGDRTVIEAIKTTVVFGGPVYAIVSLIPTTNLDEGCEFYE